MTDYTKLVEALRCKRDDCDGCDLAFFDKDEGWMCRYAAKDDDAADAIEALQAEQKKTVTQIFGEEQMAWEGRCKDLLYQIENLQAQLPKRGQWIDVDEIKTYCSNCNWASYSMLAQKDAFLLRNNKTKFCPNCGAKMEVQDG